jgi:hypothetical protein
MQALQLRFEFQPERQAMRQQARTCLLESPLINIPPFPHEESLTTLLLHEALKQHCASLLTLSFAFKVNPTDAHD